MSIIRDVVENVLLALSPILTLIVAWIIAMTAAQLMLIAIGVIFGSLLQTRFESFWRVP